MVEDMLKAAVESGAQSLLIKAGDVFRARVHGELVRLSETPFTAEDTHRIAREIIPEEMSDEQMKRLTDYDFSWDLPGTARFRVNILKQQGTYMVVMRVIPWEIPNVEQLNLPEAVRELAALENGLILVTGATGSGKSTTQAAMLGWINRNRKKHIITLEDPIEFHHDNLKGTVTQREVGKDTESFRTGLRTALRHDPDVILIGEMRDAETVEIALEAAETGQLVISTFHASTAVGTLGHFTAMFPGDDELVRKRVSESLRAVVSQKLIQTVDEETRVPAVEILRLTPAVQDAVLMDEPKSEIFRLMEEGGQQYGMQTFDQHLMELVKEGVVDYERAKSAATKPSDFELVMQTLSGEDDEDLGGFEPPEGFVSGEDQFS